MDVAEAIAKLGTIERNRRKHLFRHADRRGRGLEIGAYDQPTLLKGEGEVLYLDRQTRAELAAACPDPAQAAKIPETDVLSRSDDYVELAGQVFDHVVANHVFEHVPDPIGWLRTISAFLREGGILFLALPDKKYTFDKYRPDTPLSHLLHDHFSGVDSVSSEHMLEIELYYDLEFVRKEMRLPERLDAARLRASLDLPPHFGVHCHVFQSETFLPRILKPILYMGLVELELVDFHASSENYGEFLVVLRKSKAEVALEREEFYVAEGSRSGAGAEQPPAPSSSGLRAALRRVRRIPAAIARRLRSS